MAHWINQQTKVEYHCGVLELCREVPYLNNDSSQKKLREVLSGSRYSFKGWFLHRNYLKVMESQSNRQKGKRNNRYNPNVYTWVNEEIGIEEICTMAELGEKYGLKTNHLSSLVRGDRNFHKGWACTNLSN